MLIAKNELYIFDTKVHSKYSELMHIDGLSSFTLNLRSTRNKQALFEFEAFLARERDRAA